MSDKKLKKRTKKTVNDLESSSSSSSEFNRKSNESKNELLKLESSKSYHTAHEGVTSESEHGGLVKDTPSKYRFSTSRLDVHVDDSEAEIIDDKKHVRLSLPVSLDTSKFGPDHGDENKLKSFQSETTPQNMELSESKVHADGILKNVNDKDFPNEIELKKESSPVKFKSEAELQRESISVTFEPAEELKTLSESVSSARQISTKASKMTYTDTSLFSTNLGMGHAFVYMVIPPDGGYGWALVLISFITQMIIDGVVLSVGTTLPYIAQDLNISKTQVVLVPALQLAFYYLSGPITSAIINKFGFRKVAIIGSSLGCLCLIIASFSPNLEIMIFFYSILGGSTLSMVWVSSQLIVGYYFEKFRPIASGLSCSGSGIGLFLFSKSNSEIVPILGWRNNTRIHAGVVMLTLFLSFAFIEVAPSKIGILRERKDGDNASDTSPDEFEVQATNYADATALKLEDGAVEYIQLESLQITETKLFKSHEPNCLTKFCSKFFKCCRRDIISSKRDDGVKRYVIKKDLIDKQDLFYTGPAVYSEREKSSTTREIITGRDVELIEEEKTVESINRTFSVHTVRRPSLPIDSKIKPNKCRRYFRCYEVTKYIPRKIKKAFLVLFNFQLFKILEFQILFFSAFSFALGLNIPFLFSSDRAELPVWQKALIPSIIGASNFASRILSGLIAFTLRSYVAYICGSAITLGGLTILFSTFYGRNVFWFQMVYATLFGFAPGFFSTLRAIIYVKYLGLQNLTNAFGLIAMGMGTAVFAGTFLSGTLNALRDDCFYSFLFSGICITTSGVLKLVIPTIARRNQKT